jgi:glycosyltransferase involved in cell wall biosynthesis
VRICYFGTYSDQQGYPMNRVLLAGLKAAGAEVITCHERVFDDAADKMAGVGGPLSALGRAWRLGIAWLRLIRRFAALPDYDLLVVGYVGHLDIFLARFLSLFRRRPVVLNALVSLHDTVVIDRKLVAKKSVTARALMWLDRTAFRLADRILIDTHAHAAYLSKTFDVPRDKWLRVPVGADPEGLPDRPPALPDGKTPLTVLYFGTYIALHGVPIIVDAARQLADRQDIRFVMLGRGQELEVIQESAADLANMSFIPEWVDRPTLLAHIAAADMVLGVFGAGGKGERVVPCKVYDGLAMGRPVITANSPAAREFFQMGIHACLVPAGNSQALARAIGQLADDPASRTRLAAAGYGLFATLFDPQRIGEAVLEGLSPLLPEKPDA